MAGSFPFADRSSARCLGGANSNLSNNSLEFFTYFCEWRHGTFITIPIAATLIYLSEIFFFALCKIKNNNLIVNFAVGRIVVPHKSELIHKI
jgi:hypothetical protein